MMYNRGTGGWGSCFGDGLGYMNNLMHSGWGLLMMIGALLVTALIIVIIIVLVRRSHQSQPGAYGDNSLELLNERFVKGEITEDEYERMKKILRTR